MSGSTANMNASLTLRLQDRLSAGLGALKQRLDGIRASAERIGALGAIGAGFAVGAPIAAAARLDDQLRAIAINAGKSGAAAEAYIAKLRTQFQALALETAQSSAAVTAAAALMIQRAMPADLIERLMPITARVATAASADMKDIAGVVEALTTNLAVLPQDAERSLAMLVVAAKEGKVELKDMAREFPALASAANMFGLKGLDGVRSLASALQVAAKASATPAEAANNLANLFQALRRPETLKNFKEHFKVNFEDVMKDAEKKGLNPLEAALQKIMKITGGSPFRLGELFGDKQANEALMPFLRDFGREYLRISDVVKRSRIDILTEDFLTRMNGAAAKIAQVTEAVGQLADRFGRELFSRIGMVLAPLSFLLVLMNQVDSMAPDLIGEIIRWAAAFLAITAALGVLVTVLPIVLAGFRAIWLVLKGVFFFVPLLVKGFAALAAVAGTIAAPILAIIAVVALIAGAIWTIYSEWDSFALYFADFFRGLRTIARGFVYALDALFRGDLAGVLNGFKMLWDGVEIALGASFDVMRQLMIKWIDGGLAWVAEEVQAVVNAFKKVWDDVATWFNGLWSRFKWPTGPNLSTWSDKPSSISNEAVADVWKRRLETARGYLVGPGAGDVARAPGGPMGHLQITVTTKDGAVAHIGPHSAWLDPQVKDAELERLRAGRGPVSPEGRP